MGDQRPGDGLMSVIDMLGRNLAVLAEENARLAAENTQLREHLAAIGRGTDEPPPA